ncbi:MAG: two-component regulator propeller domain-containing protein, partial [Bacteroidota bacterium]
LKLISCSSYIGGSYEDEAQTIYLSSVNSGAWSISRKGEKNYLPFPNSLISDIWKTSDGKLQFTCTRGIQEDSGNGTYQLIATFATTNIARTHKRGSKIAIGLANYVYLFDVDQRKVLREFQVPDITTEIIRVYWEGQDIWLGTRDGAYRLSFENDAYDNYQLTTYLGGLSVTSILRDRESNIWFSTMESGVFLTPSPQVLHYTVADGLPHHRILKLEKDFNQRLWIGSIQNKYAILNNNSIETHQLEFFQKSPISGFLHLSTDESWVIGRGGSVRIRNGQKAYLIRSISSILMDKAEHMWLGHWLTSRSSIKDMNKKLLSELDPQIAEKLRWQLKGNIGINEQ